MGILVRMLKYKTAVYWAPKGFDEAGEIALDLPIEIQVRWEDDLEQGIDAQGTETTFMSTVYVDRDVEEGGILMFGELKDLKRALPPPEGISHRIRKFSKIRKLRKEEYLRTVRL